MPPLTPSAPPLPSLLLGTSLLRNVDQSKLHNCEVIAKGGASVSKLQEVLNTLPDDKRFNELIIVAGSIDIESKSTDDIITDYIALTVIASQKAEKISICSILPRTDKDLTAEASKLNEELKKSCCDIGHNFLEIEDAFYLRNGNVNSACLLPDGLHLTNHGVDSLINSCKIALKQNVKSAFSEQCYANKPTQKETFFKGHENPLSNFFPVRGLYVDGISFATTEAAYVYQKAMFHGDRETAQNVKRSKTGIHAKRLGDKIHTTPAWQQKKVDVMDNLLRIKIKTCGTTRKALKDSGESKIIEDTPNAFWGRGNDNNGKNMLGQMWMLYRKKLNAFEPKKAWATREKQPRCYRCNEHGHLIDQCGQREHMKCWKCNSSGHKQKHCREFNAGQNRISG